MITPSAKVTMQQKGCGGKRVEENLKMIVSNIGDLFLK